jgi:hypothetical protein
MIVRLLLLSATLWYWIAALLLRGLGGGLLSPLVLLLLDSACEPIWLWRWGRGLVLLLYRVRMRGLWYGHVSAYMADVLKQTALPVALQASLHMCLDCIRPLPVVAVGSIVVGSVVAAAPIGSDSAEWQTGILWILR